jgi:hypothetical protein
VALDCYDVRFPTSLEFDGSDAMNPDPDYSAAYAVLRTDASGLEGIRCASRSGGAMTWWWRRSRRCAGTWWASTWRTSLVTWAGSAPRWWVTASCGVVQHLAMFDYVAVSAATDGRVLEYVNHLHEHLTDPARVTGGRYLPPRRPGFSTTLRPRALADYEFPGGAVWQQLGGGRA